MRRYLLHLSVFVGLSIPGVLSSVPLHAGELLGFAWENGDINGDGERDLSDGIGLLGHLFIGGPAPVPLALCGSDAPIVQNGDTNGDGSIDISDPIQLLGWLFLGSSQPVPACGAGQGVGGETLRSPFAIDAVFFSAGAPAEREWVDDEGVAHVRQDQAPANVSGDFEGILIVFNNQNVDLSTGNGDIYGSFTFDVTWQGMSGTWEGRYSGTITGGFSSGEFVGQGSGGLAGTKIKGTFKQIDPGASVFELAGIILTPGG